MFRFSYIYLEIKVLNYFEKVRKHFVLAILIFLDFFLIIWSTFVWACIAKVWEMYAIELNS